MQVVLVDNPLATVRITIGQNMTSNRMLPRAISKLSAMTLLLLLLPSL